jgi:hypothetical protein
MSLFTHDRYTGVGADGTPDELVKAEIEAGLRRSLVGHHVCQGEHILAVRACVCLVLGGGGAERR